MTQSYPKMAYQPCAALNSEGVRCGSKLLRLVGDTELVCAACGIPRGYVAPVIDWQKNDT